MGDRKGVGELISVQEVAERLNTSVRTIWKLDREKKIPEAFKIGCRKRWCKDDIELWLCLKCPDRAEFNKLKNERESDDRSRSN